MRDLFRLNWQAFNADAGVKVTVGLLVMLGLEAVTGHTWLATAFVAMCAWLADVPGTLSQRNRGIFAFAVAAIALTGLAGVIGLDLWANVVAIAVVGWLGTMALAWGLRAFMVGWVLICWAIYVPLLVESTSVLNCVGAIVVGSGVVMGLNALAVRRRGRPDPAPDSDTAPAAEMGFVVPYSMTVALVLGLTTYYGWVELQQDPTLMVGGAFFVIGFDTNKTWLAGIGRIIGLTGGILLGLAIGNLVGTGLIGQSIMVAVCGTSFAAMAVHPGAWMFFFMIFVAMGWSALDPQAFDATVRERFYGESMGVVAAMIAIVFLQWWQQARTSGRRRPAA